MSLFDNTGHDVTEVKIPTLKQYLKKMKGKKLPSKFLLTRIWIPNKFPAYTLECDLFRISIPKKSPLGTLLSGNLSEIIDSNACVFISVEVGEGNTEKITFLPGKEQGVWYDIGEDNPLGYRFDNE